MVVKTGHLKSRYLKFLQCVPGDGLRWVGLIVWRIKEG